MSSVASVLRRASSDRMLGVALALVLDRVTKEPPNRVHPVAIFGTQMQRVEQRLWADRRSNGVVYTSIGVVGAALAGALSRSVLLSTWVAVAGTELRRTGARLSAHLEADDLEGARAALPSLVGRDPSQLDASGISAAVIESIAENTVDAVVAPVFWGLVAGAPGAAAYRAVNTMDAMVGHRSERYERFGWASARVDDVANWLPARIFAVLVAVQQPDRATAMVRLIRRDAAAHPSPNAGVAETAMAAAIGRELGGPLRYGERHESRPRLGDGPRPSERDVHEAIRVASRTEWLMTATIAAAWVGRRMCGGAR